MDTNDVQVDLASSVRSAIYHFKSGQDQDSKLAIEALTGAAARLAESKDLRSGSALLYCLSLNTIFLVESKLVLMIASGPNLERSGFLGFNGCTRMAKSKSRSISFSPCPVSSGTWWLGFHTINPELCKPTCFLVNESVLRYIFFWLAVRAKPHIEV